MLTFEALSAKKEKIAVVGLGYVGLPLAVHLSRYFDVVGYDFKSSRIAELTSGKENPGTFAHFRKCLAIRQHDQEKFLIVTLNPCRFMNPTDTVSIKRHSYTQGKGQRCGIADHIFG